MIKVKKIAKMIDHALLRPDLTRDEVIAGCRIAAEYEVASVCVKPCDVSVAFETLKGSGVLVSTVVAFPHGVNLTAVKVMEAEVAIAQGCKEIDMVLNIGRLKGGDFDYIEHEIRTVCETAHRKGALVKVIFENAYLTPQLIAKASELAEDAGADYIKTSTGFAAHGALLEDLLIMKASISGKVKLKAAGGVRNLDDALAAKAVGCDRIGTSSTIQIIEEARKRELEGTLEIPEDPHGLSKTDKY